VTESRSGAATQLFKEIRTPVAPVREQLVNQIRELITSGELTSGRRITERELTEESGASRTVVRESLRQLEAEGLLRRERSRLVVAGVTLDETLEIYAIQASLEGLAASACAQRASDSVVAEIRQAEVRFQDTIALGDLEGALALRDELYGLIYAGSGLAIVASTMRNLQARVRSMRGAPLADPAKAAETAAEIRRLVAAIEAHDPVEARAAAGAHVRSAATVLVDTDIADDRVAGDLSLLSE